MHYAKVSKIAISEIVMITKIDKINSLLAKLCSKFKWCETNNSTLLHEHTPNLYFIEHILHYTDRNSNSNYCNKQDR